MEVTQRRPDCIGRSASRAVVRSYIPSRSFGSLPDAIQPIQHILHVACQGTTEDMTVVMVPSLELLKGQNLLWRPQAAAETRHADLY